MLLVLVVAWSATLAQEYSAELEAKAASGDVAAMNSLGVCYVEGRGVAQDVVRGAGWFRRGADMGSRMAMRNLALCHSTGRGAEANPATAFLWWTKAAELGDAESMYNLGACAYAGLGTDQDYEVAVSWWQKAAERGIAPAFNSLGYCYAHGLGVAQSGVRAAELYAEGAHLADGESIRRLAEAYTKGQDVEQNLSKANLLRSAVALLDAGDENRAMELVDQALPAVTKDQPYEPFGREYVKRGLAVWSAQNPDADADATARKTEELVACSKTTYINSIKAELSLNLTLKDYIAERGAFLVLDPQFGEIFVEVPQSDTAKFRQYWLQHEVHDPHYAVEEGRVVLSSLIISMPYGGRYGYNTDPAQIDVQPAEPTPAQDSDRKVFLSDVDENIPENPTDNTKTFVLVVANEQYRRGADAECALRDGEIFARYCHLTLGVPEANIHFAPNATLNDMRFELAWLRRAVRTYGPQAEVIVYFAGHGSSDPATRDAYLMPSDGYCHDLKSGVRLSDLCSALTDLRVRSSLVLIDASFAGVQRDGATLETNFEGRLMPRLPVATGKVMVFMAADADQTAYVYREKGHGMFTYFMLRKLQETRGEVTLGDLSRYVARAVREQTEVEWRGRQSPRAVVAITLSHIWRSMRLR